MTVSMTVCVRSAQGDINVFRDAHTLKQTPTPYEPPQCHHEQCVSALLIARYHNAL